MLEKSKIRQMLLDKSLVQILKVEGPVESIQTDEPASSLSGFHQHFKTTAKRDYSAVSRHRSRIEKTPDDAWKCNRPRTPSCSFNCRQRITIFDEHQILYQQSPNPVNLLPWEPIRKHIPLSKQTQRKPWFTQNLMHDTLGDPPKPKTICFVNYQRAATTKERNTLQYHIDEKKATETYLHLKPNYWRRNLDFTRLVDRNNASPYINKS